LEHGDWFSTSLAIVAWNLKLIAHSFFCLGLDDYLASPAGGPAIFKEAAQKQNRQCQDNVGLKTRECQSRNGRVLSLNRQADIGPHPTPQAHPKYSCTIKTNLLFRLTRIKKEFTSYITSMCYSDDRGSISYDF
jgi:hypothetical protein